MQIFGRRKGADDDVYIDQSLFPDPIAIAFGGDAEFRHKLAEQQQAREAREDALISHIDGGFATADRMLAEAAKTARSAEDLTSARQRHFEQRVAVLQVAISLYGYMMVDLTLTRHLGLSLIYDFKLY